LIAQAKSDPAFLYYYSAVWYSLFLPHEGKSSMLIPLAASLASVLFR